MNNYMVYEMNRSGGSVLLLLVVVAVIACLGGYTWGEDAAIERLTERQRAVEQREKALQTAEKACFAEGFGDGRRSVQCLGGFAVDRRTGKPLQIAEGR